jgi:phospholipid-hydroperoxide glutathione peroxidase
MNTDWTETETEPIWFWMLHRPLTQILKAIKAQHLFPSTLTMGGKCSACSNTVTPVAGMGDDWKSAKSAYDFNYIDIDGNPQSMRNFEGHPLIVVNVASKWGKTRVNYEQLTALYEKYSSPADGSKGLKIIGFPCNQFANQEPGTEAEIKEFVKQYNVTFDLTSKVNVNGDEAHPLWKWMKSQKGGTLIDAIKWNFTKFLLDRSGQVIERFGTTTDPFDMEKDIEKLMTPPASL